jgi:serine/threonine-protein kinase
VTVPFTIQDTLRFEVTSLIYEGGMGAVYEAQQHGAHGFVKRVAMKVIRDRYAKQSQFIENFIGEAKLVADLIHTNIVQTYHLGESRGVYFITMELIRGVNLEQFMTQLQEKEVKLPVELAVFIMSRVARGLAYAHAKTAHDGKPLGIVHRDVSPKNVMIAFEGDVKLTDFGIAKARGFLKDQEGEVVAGKADYMSPEQADFQITDKRSDIFSVGIVLAQLLLGYNLFKGSAPEDSRQRVLTKPIPDFSTLNPAIEPRLNQLLHRCLARKLEARYSSAEELLYDLEFFIYHKGYGPTNETLGKFVREIFVSEKVLAASDPTRGATRRIVRGGTKSGLQSTSSRQKTRSTTRRRK